MALTITALGMWADTQADFNKSIKAYNSQMNSRQYLPAAKSAASAASACVEAKNYEGAFRLLSDMENTLSVRKVTPDSLPAVYYTTAKARYAIYQKLNNHASAGNWLQKMATYAKKANTKELTNDMLFTEAQYYYSVDQTAKGDHCIARLIKQFDNAKDYKAADAAYQDIINRAVSSNDARLVDHTYENYIKWSDSIEAITANTELSKIKKEYAQSCDTIAQKDHTIKAKTGVIATFVTLFVISLIALAVGAMFYFRVVAKNRRMKKTVQAANEQSAAKSAILHNMSSQMAPSLEKLDQNDPAVQHLKGYVKRVGELSEVEDAEPKEEDQLEDVNLEPFCKEITDEVRPLLKRGVTVTLNGTKGMAHIDGPEVRKILEHLLENAAKFTPEGGKITLTYKKRGAKSHQFIVTDSGPGIPEDERETLFKAFNSSRDISEGDGLGLPICALRAEKLNGSLTLDPTHTQGAAFILTIHS